jgi:hypothetical protein
VAYSISILSEDRNFSPPPDPLFIPSNILCGEDLPRGLNSGSEKLIMPLYLVIILKVIGAICLFPHIFPEHCV